MAQLMARKQSVNLSSTTLKLSVLVEDMSKAFSVRKFSFLLYPFTLGLVSMSSPKIEVSLDCNFDPPHFRIYLSAPKEHS